MTTPKFLRCTKCIKLFDFRNLHFTPTLGKKVYNYDLDSLVKWKQETNLLFGPVRKTTKTGKDKKVKNEVQPKENMEVLSYVAKQNLVSTDDSKVSKRKPKKDRNSSFCDIPDHVISIMGSAQADERYDGGERNYGMSHSYNPEHNFSDFEEPIVERSKLKKKIAGQKENLDSPVPQQQLTSDKMHENRFPLANDDTLPVFPETDVLVSSTNSWPVSSDASTQNLASDFEDKQFRTEISIPKIEPIPSGSTPKPKITFPPKTPPSVIEAPDSFEVIGRYPLSPSQNNLADKVDLTQLERFQQEVAKMSLRTPPSVKTVLNKTMPDLSRFFLQRWRDGMIKELGEEGFKKYKEATLRQGTNLHANIMEFLSGRPESEIQIQPENEGHWSSLQTAIQMVGDVRAVEQDVMHRDLLYRGITDCVATYKDLLCVIDWKVSKRTRPLLKNTYDDPLQVAAYVGALNSDGEFLKKHAAIQHGLIVVVYPDGSPAHAHLMNREQMDHYWAEWTARLHTYYTLAYTEKAGAKLSAGSELK